MVIEFITRSACKCYLLSVRTLKVEERSKRNNPRRIDVVVSDSSFLPARYTGELNRRKQREQRF